MLSTEPGTCGRLHVNSSSYHSKHSPAPRLSPTWLVYPYSAFTLLPPFNLFITGLTEEQRKHQDQTHQIGNFCFSSFFLLFITREHTTFRHATLLFHPAIHGLCCLFHFYHNSKQYTNQCLWFLIIMPWSVFKVLQYSWCGFLPCRPTVFCHFYSMGFIIWCYYL